MIPAIVADELRATLLDYLDTTFSFQDVAVAEALQRFLTDPKQGIFKGPYLRLQLPFRRAEANEAQKILDIAPPFVPYVHQITAFERLTGKDNHQPQHTLVTTGTGSGKTECFLYPVLDHCHRHAGRAGHQGHRPLPHERPGRRPGPAAGEGDLERAPAQGPGDGRPVRRRRGRRRGRWGPTTSSPTGKSSASTRRTSC